MASTRRRWLVTGLVTALACTAGCPRAEETAPNTGAPAWDLPQPQASADVAPDSWPVCSQPDGAAAGPGFAQVPSSIHVATIVDLTGTVTSTEITARLLRAPWPATHEVAMEKGSCRLLLRKNNFCDPPCDFGKWCDDSGKCSHWWSAPVDAGTMTVSGGDTEMPGGMHAPGPDYPFPGFDGALFAPGSEVTVSAPGAEFPAFGLSATMVEPLHLTNLEAFTLQGDEDLLITWECADPSSRIRVTLNREAGHGKPYDAVIECDSADTGSLFVPKEMVKALSEISHFGCGVCPWSTFSRYHRTTTKAGPYEVELFVESTKRIIVSFFVDIDPPW